MKRLLLFVFLLLIVAVQGHSQVPGKVPDIFGYTYSDNAQLRFGKSEDFACTYSTVQTPDSMICGVSADSRSLILAEKADIRFDFAHPLQTNPTLFVHSSAQSTNQWISVTHNGTNGVVNVGTGTVSFPSGLSTTGTLSAGATTVTGLDMSNGAITNINILTLPQADLGATCTTGQARIDTGGNTVELCYCKSTNAWYCTALAAGPTD